MTYNTLFATDYSVAFLCTAESYQTVRMYGECLSLGGCDKDCHAYQETLTSKTSKCRYCFHDESEHKLLGIMDASGNPVFLPTCERCDS